MASISSLGIGSGVLTSDLVDQLVEVERESTDNRLDFEEELVNAEISEFSLLKGLVSDFESSVSGLNLTSSFSNTTSTSSDESAVTGTSSSVASQGIYSIEVDTLAQSQTLASMEFSSLDSIVGEGTLTFRFGEVETTADGDGNVTSFDDFTVNSEVATQTLKVDSGNHTVSGLRDAINDADLGVTATIVDTGSGYRLLLQSESTGVDNGFIVTVTNATNGLDDFSFNSGTVGSGLLHTTQASDAEFSVNGLNITREENLVTGVINGVTLNLKQTTAGPITYSVEYDTEAVSEKMQTFVDSYNDLKSKINELTDYNEEEQLGSLFIGDSTVRNLQTQLQRVLGSVVSSLSGTEFRSLSEVGISTNKDTGLLEFDSATFTSLLTSNVDNMTALFGKTGSATDSQISFLSAGTNTVAGDYDVVITQLATQGTFEGHSTTGSFVINGDNDAFKINVNGTVSDTIVLTHGAYTGDELAELLQAQINSDDALVSDGRGVDVAYDSDQQSFNITSSSYGSLSSVSFNTLDAETEETLGFYIPGQGPRLVGTSSNLATLDTLASNLVIDDTNDDFSLTVGGITSESIELANATYTDGSDLAAALQAAINGDSNFSAEGILATVSYSGDQDEGRLDITFNNNETYSIEAADAGLASALGITTGQQVTDSVAGLAVVDDFASSVTIDSTNDEFSLTVDGNTTNTIQIANASYTDGASLAIAVEAAIQADTVLQAQEAVAAQGAETGYGSFDIDTAGIDFSASNRGLILDLNGTQLEVLVNQDATADLNGDSSVGDVNDNLFAIQAALDSALTGAGFSAGDIVASESASGLVLSTAATGSSETLNVIADGGSVQTSSGSVVLDGTDDFTAPAGATFDLDVNGTTASIDLSAINVVSGDPNDTLSAIQSALDTGLTNAGLSSGDVEARLDGSNQAYFVDVSNQGASATLGVTAVGANDVLGLSGITGTTYNGTDGFGLTTGAVTGTDSQSLADVATVSFEGGDSEGGLNISFGHSVIYTVETAEADMEAALGIVESDGSETTVARGVDVEGTINGVAAVGTGQLLVGATGDDVEGLSIEVNGGPIGTRGTISFVRGIADQLESLLDSLLSESLTNKEAALQTELTEISEERVELEERIESFRARLEAQFLRNDIIVSQLNSTQEYLQTQFEVLNSIYTGND